MSNKCTTQQYIHVSQRAKIGPPQRFYETTEKILDYKSKNILFLVMSADSLTFCDGHYGVGLENVVVTGYIESWQTKQDSEGSLISEVTPITNEQERNEIKKILQKDHLPNIRFW